MFIENEVLVMKRIGKVLLLVVLLVGAGFGYVQYKKSAVEHSVMDYLINKEKIPKDDILYSEPFIANLRGDKNWMVCIKLKNDPKTYYYYKHKGDVILESYIENGEEHVQ